MRLNLQKIFLLLFIFLLLTGCVALVGGAVVGSATAATVYDHRDVKTIVDDDWLRHRVDQFMSEEPELVEKCHISAAVYHNNILLVGQAPTAELKQRAESVARKVPELRRLYNEITVEEPISMFLRTQDSWITTQVKSTLINTEGLKSGAFKVVTENSAVFLMGIVTHEQADLAVEQTRRIEHVRRVIKVFEYTP
jgi:osmotically-inducible protein OsmY